MYAFYIEVGGNFKEKCLFIIPASIGFCIPKKAPPSRLRKKAVHANVTLHISRNRN